MFGRTTRRTTRRTVRFMLASDVRAEDDVAARLEFAVHVGERETADSRVQCRHGKSDPAKLYMKLPRRLDFCWG
jgi:hypothetical protein